MLRQHPLGRFLLIAAALVVWPGPLAASAQADTGKVVGTIKDSAGAVLPGVTVWARDTNARVTREALTSDAGTFEIPSLPIGTYEISAERSGFKKYVRQRISVEVNQEARVDFELQPGELAEIVIVEGDATQVQTTTSTLGKVMSGKLIVDLPLNGRSFYDLGLLQTGVVPLQPGRTLTQNAYNVNGARDTANNFLLDGVSNQELEYNAIQIRPSIDALSEFKIQTNNYSAEFGRSAGAIVNAVIKSGTANVHGSAWNFLRNDAFDARNFFSPEVPPLRRNQFGGTVGGPLSARGLLQSGSPTFFFFCYEGLRQRRGVTASTVVPTEQERRGDLSAVPAPIVDPETSQPFPNNVIPPDRISPAARAVLDLYPLPNVAGAPRSLNFSSTPTQEIDQNQYILRLDHSRSQGDFLFGRYVYDKAVGVDPFQFGNVPAQFPGFASDQVNANHNLALGYTWVPSPTLVNDVRFGFSRTDNPTSFSPLTKPKSLGIDFDVPENVGPPDIRIAGFSGVGNSIFGPSHHVFNTFELRDNVTLVRGRNIVKAGVEFRQHRENAQLQFAANGQFVFAGVFTGDAFADFLLGRAFYFTFGSFTRDTLRQRWGATNLFVQDDLRLAPRLTLNLGARYEYVTPIVEKDGLAATVLIRRQPIPGVPQSGEAEVVLAGSNGLCDDCTYLPDMNNWGPRLGFAYDVFGNGRLAVRGGYGVFFNQLESNLALQNLLQPPFASFPLVVDSGGLGFASLDSPTCGGRCTPPGGGLVLVTDPHLRTPYMQHFNLDVQYEVLPDLMLEGAYVGTLGRKLLQFRDLNQPIFIPGTDRDGNPLSTNANKDQRRPFPGFGTIAQSTDYGRSNYHALQASVSKRFGRGYTLLAGYTFSKSIDLASQFHSGSGSPIDPAVAQDANDLDADRGLSSFDMRHRVTLSGVFELPFGSGRRFLNRDGLVDKLVGGWSLSPILLLASGVPLTVRDFTDPCLVAGPFLTSCRPNLVRDPNLPDGGRTPERWFDESAFAGQTPGAFGTAGRNIVFADGAQNLDLAIIKRTYFKHGERAPIVEFRVEIFNVANHPQFGPPDLNFSSPTFGRVFSTARGTTERQIQFGLKISL